MDDNDEFNAREDFDDEQDVDYVTKKQRIIRLLLGYSAIAGVIILLLPDDDRVLNFLMNLPIVIFGVSWCYNDAAERDHRIGVVTRFLLVLLIVVGLPIYLLQTRGFGGFKAIGLLLLLVAAMFSCMIATGLVAAIVGDWTGLWYIPIS